MIGEIQTGSLTHLFYPSCQSKGRAQPSFTSKLLETDGTPETESVIIWTALGIYAGEARFPALPSHVHGLFATFSRWNRHSRLHRCLSRHLGVPIVLFRQ
jgi:hypothetical protein